MYSWLRVRPTSKDEILLRVATPAVFHRHCEIRPGTTQIAEVGFLPELSESLLEPGGPIPKVVLVPTSALSRSLPR